MPRAAAAVQRPAWPGRPNFLAAGPVNILVTSDQKRASMGVRVKFSRF